MLDPWARNLFENDIAVQFNHRLLAVVTVAAALGLWFVSHRLALAARARTACTLVLVMAALQLGLGVSTLLLVVPVWLGAVHQAGAMMLLTLALWAIHQVRPN